MSSDSTPVHRDEAQAAPASEREQALELAYAQGDFAQLRARARELADDASAPDAVREHARAWSERVSVDVVVYGMLAFALVLFCAIVLRYAL
jgi:hypothetical protein